MRAIVKSITPKWFALGVLLGTLGVYLVWLLPQLMWIDDQGIWVGQIHLWSDWPWHVAMMQQLAAGVWTHPLIAGETLRYPFGMALLSAGLLKLGLSIIPAFIWPMVVLSLLLLMGMHRFWMQAFKNPWLALLPVFLFFLSAGPGFLYWFDDIKAQGWSALLFPPKEYGIPPEQWGYQWYAGNFLVGMLLPQRAFLPGMTLAVWLLCAMQSANTQRAWLLIGLAAGLLPLVHMHSLIAFAFLGAALLWPRRDQWQQWSFAFIPGGLLALFNYGFFLHPETAYPNFTQIKIGYQANTFSDWCLMWWRFWGLALPFTLAGCFCMPKGQIRGIAFAAAGLFVLANVVLLQPIAWDNSKVLLWAYFGFCGPLTCLLVYCWKRRPYTKSVALVGFILLTLTGIVDLLRLSQVKRNAWVSVSARDWEVANQIREKTPKDAVFLTAMDIANSALWAGRPIFLGFGGWMSNFGFDHQQREADLKTMFAGAAQAQTLLQQWKIDYVYISENERNNWGANDAWYAQHYPVFYQAPGVSVYKISRR